MSDFSIAGAIEAAGRTARLLGLGEIAPAPLHVSEHVTLRLPEASAVVRIKPAADEAVLRREVAVATHLAGKGAPVVPPLSGPHVESGFAMSFWGWVPHRPADETHGRLAIETLRQVHEAFADYPGLLPSLQNKLDHCRGLLRDAPMPALKESDRRFLLEVADTFQEVNGEAVPIHGDAGLHNLLITGDRALWTDFEAVCRGPRGWDEAALGLCGDPAVVRLRSFCVSVWCWKAAEAPEKREAAEYHLRQLRGG